MARSKADKVIISEVQQENGRRYITVTCDLDNEKLSLGQQLSAAGVYSELEEGLITALKIEINKYVEGAREFVQRAAMSITPGLEK